MKLLKSFFGAEPQQRVAVLEQPKNEDQLLIDQIHNEFDTAPQRLLEEALSVINKESASKIKLESKIEDKALRLKSLGFESNGVVAKLNEINDRNRQKDNVIEMERKTAESIAYYSKTYPFLKFLTESELDRICDKYGLIYAPVKHYKMPVPEKNLKDIENAQKIKNEDELKNKITYEYISDERYNSGYGKIKKLLGGKTTFTEDEAKEAQLKFGRKGMTDRYKDLFWDISKNPDNRIEATICYAIVTTEDRTGLFIAAPKEHFNLEGLKFDNKKGHFQVTRQVVKDPIVFRYVKGGIQVLTKWGLEGEDPALQMEILN